MGLFLAVFGFFGLLRFALGFCGIGQGGGGHGMRRNKRFRGGFVLNIVQKPGEFGLGGGQIGNGVQHAFGAFVEGDAADFALIEADVHVFAADQVGRLQGIGIAQVVNALGFAKDLHLGEFLLRGESLHHGIALNLGVVEVVFLDGHEGVGEGLETANFLLLHLHFHGIATESGQGVPQHRLAAKIEGRIAAV